ncbi:MAG: heavy metal translocating P-type ATPase [Labilithrix sp.]|nr:heavy metal translocating P-type ATPase [Labilithrix sp.]
MTCNGCAKRVERALVAAPGVTRAEVSFATRSAKVLLTDPEQQLGGALAAITQAGFTPAASRAQILARRTAEAKASAERAEQQSAARRATVALAIACLQMAFSAPFMAHGMAAAAALEGPAMHPLLRPALLVTTLVVMVIARSFFVRAWAALRARTADMNTLVALGSGTAFLYSAVVTVAPGPFAIAGRLPEVHFEAASFILAFVLVGRALEGRARALATSARTDLLALVPAVATLLRDGEAGALEIKVPVSEVAVGDVVVLRPGDRAPADGVVVSGRADADESLLTGESDRIPKEVGDAVLAGSITSGGLVHVRVTAAGEDTRIARIVALVEEAQTGRAPVQHLADRVAAWFAPGVLAVATLAALAWGILGPEPRLATALTTFVTVVVVSCPCALGLATPTALATGLGRAAELGILVRSGEALERLARVDTVAFDKTGTLTEGQPELVELVVVRPAGATGTPEEDERDADRLLGLAAAVEHGSEHPVGRAIAEEAAARGLEVPRADGFVAAAGGGARATVAGGDVRVGAIGWLASEGVVITGVRPEAAFGIAVGTTLAAYGLVADRLRDDAAAVVARLRALGLRLVVLSGDRAEVAREVARELGIDEVEASLTPEGKLEALERLASEGRHVAMCGDGVNDAPALARADVGIALASGTDAAAAASDVTLLSGGLARLPEALELARRTLRVVRQNLAWAFVYNVALMPVAAGALVPLWGLRLPPALASAAMALSSISVVVSSLRLRRFARGRTLP